jgi:hypothetical protein
VRRREFSLGRLLVGITLIALVGAGVAFAVAKTGGGPSAGRLVYASRQGVFVHELSSGRDERLATLPSDVVAAIPSPDGKWVAYSRGAGQVWLASLEQKRRFQVADRFVVPLGWSPDGRLLASELLSDKDLVAIDPEKGPEVLASGLFPAISVPVWLDDHRVAIATSDKQFVILDTAAGRKTDPLDGTPLAASPDGAELLIARADLVAVVKIVGGRPTAARLLFHGRAEHAAASERGFLAIAAKDADGNPGVWVFEGGSKSRKVVSGTVSGIGWTTRGAVLLFERRGVVYAVERPGAPPKRLSREGADVFPLLSFTIVP